MVREIAEHRSRDRHGLGEREIDVLTDAGTTRPCGRDHDGRRAVEPTDVFGEAPSGLHRVARRLAPKQHRARLGLDDEVGGGAIRQRAAGAERGDRQDDEVWVTRAHAVDVEAAGPEALDDDVGVGEQRVDVRIARLADHGALARAEVAEERRAFFEGYLLTRRAVGAERIAAGRLHLDHVDARVDEQLRGVSTGDARAEVDRA